MHINVNITKVIENPHAILYEIIAKIMYLIIKKN